MRKTPIMINDKHRPVTRLMSERLNPKTKYGCKKKKKKLAITKQNKKL